MCFFQTFTTAPFMTPPLLFDIPPTFIDLTVVSLHFSPIFEKSYPSPRERGGWNHDVTIFHVTITVYIVSNNSCNLLLLEGNPGFLRGHIDFNWAVHFPPPCYLPLNRKSSVSECYILNLKKLKKLWKFPIPLLQNQPSHSWLAPFLAKLAISPLQLFLKNLMTSLWKGFGLCK